MIRIIIPRNVYNKERLALVNRIMPLQETVYSCVMGRLEEIFFYGFLESEENINRIAECLTDNPLYVWQGDYSNFGDMTTVLIEDSGISN